MGRRSRRATQESTAAASDGRWTVAQAAEYAAKRDFAFCQLLATDRRAFSVARRLRFGSSHQMSSLVSAHGAVSVRAPSPGGGAQQKRGADTARAPNHRQRRSAARSARHHADHAAPAPAAAAPAAAVAAPAAAPAAEAARPPCATAPADEVMADDRPSSPTCLEHVRALLDASDALARRQRDRVYCADEDSGSSRCSCDVDRLD